MFIIVATLYFSYIVEFDHLINENKRHETGNVLIYLHYFILFGLSMITVSLKFIDEATANHQFAVSCLYLGILFFYIGIFLANHYNHSSVRQASRFNILFLAVSIIIAYFVSIYAKSLPAVTLTTSIFSFLNTAMMVRLYYRLNR